MPIHALPQFEADVEADKRAYEALKPPRTIVVRFGVLKMVGEFPYDGQAKPGCGSKLIVRTTRGTELGEMLTSTCPNAGCSKSVSRKEMLDYIQNSGGRDYPFTTEGRVLRIATKEDLDEQARLEQSRHGLKVEARKFSEDLKLPIKIVDAEPILGGERLTFYYTSEERPDFRELLHELSARFRVRIDIRQVGARDEARITADYERCGQHCCCKTFLKVLKPISMRSAKTQKATLDPLKISGRCGRLMCCLRYEDQTYEELRKRLPKRRVRVGTPEGDGWVVDTQILTQLVLVHLEATDKEVAVPVENLTPPAGPPPPPFIPGAPMPVRPGERRPPDRRPPDNSGRGSGPPSNTPSGTPARRPDARPDARPDGRPDGRPDSRPDSRRDTPHPGPPQRRPDRPPAPVPLPNTGDLDEGPDNGPDDGPDSGPGEGVGETQGGALPGGPPGAPGDQPRRRRRRRRRNRRPPGAPDSGPPGGSPPAPPPPPAA